MAENYPNPIIFVHGIQGAWLKNHYPVNYQDEIYWTGIMKREFENLQLSVVDSTIDRDFDKFIFAHQAVPFVYESIVNELRQEASKYTYAFTYDWRKDNRLSANMLATFVDLILKKVAVHAKQEGCTAPKKVALVGHSMGGLVIKWYVTQILKNKALDVVDKIITIATPYRGSLKAVEALLPGARNFFGLESQKAMRTVSRTLPGVYQLLPSWQGAVVDGKTKEPLSIFDRKNWQDNLLKKMDQDYGRAFFQAMLDDAREFTDAVKEDYSAEIARRVVCAYGTGSTTWKQALVTKADGNWYDFEHVVEDDNGDGTVHTVSSRVQAAKEFKDEKQMIELGGQHAQMPNHGVVQDFIVQILTKNEYIVPFKSTK